MEHVGFICLLMCVSVHAANSEKQSCVEKNICLLKCGTEKSDSVTWSRDVDGKRVKILTVDKKTLNKNITRYGSGGGLILSIFKVSFSDAGRYYCNDNTVELRVKTKAEIITQVTTRSDTWMVPAIVAGGCVLGLVSVLLVFRCFSKRKGGTVKTEQDPAENGEHLDQIHTYECIYETLSAPKPGNQQITEDGIYCLATPPGVQSIH